MTNITHRALELEMSDNYVTKVANQSGNQSQSEGPLIGISPETILDTVLEVPGQLQLPWEVIIACLPICLLFWN